MKLSWDSSVIQVREPALNYSYSAIANLGFPCKAGDASKFRAPLQWSSMSTLAIKLGSVFVKQLSKPLANSLTRIVLANQTLREVTVATAKVRFPGSDTGKASKKDWQKCCFCFAFVHLTCQETDILQVWDSDVCAQASQQEVGTCRGFINSTSGYDTMAREKTFELER